jgi:hypothetical protein
MIKADVMGKTYDTFISKIERFRNCLRENNVLDQNTLMVKI